MSEAVQRQDGQATGSILMVPPITGTDHGMGYGQRRALRELNLSRVNWFRFYQALHTYKITDRDYHARTMELIEQNAITDNFGNLVSDVVTDADVGLCVTQAFARKEFLQKFPTITAALFQGVVNFNEPSAEEKAADEAAMP
jgi:hypothetical protein